MFWSSTLFRSRTLPSLAVVALLAAACSNSPAAPTVKTVSISGAMNGYSYSIVPDTGCTGAEVGYSQTGLDLAGTLSSLGNTTWTAQHCNKTLSTIPLLIDAYSLHATMTAANGDQLSFTYSVGETAPGSGHIVPGTLEAIVSTSPRQIADFNFPLSFAGGTGSFAKATGTGLIVCVRTTPIAGDPALPTHTPAYSNIYACTITGTVTTT